MNRDHVLLQAGDEDRTVLALAMVKETAMRVSAILLAAGASSRLGRNKLLEVVGGKTVVVRAAEAMLTTCASVTVVVGFEAGAVAAALADLPVKLVRNPAYRNGMSTSLRCGLAAVSPESDGILIGLGDMPLLRTDHLIPLLHAFERSGGYAICLPSWNGALGHPRLFPMTLRPLLAQTEGDQGPRHLLDAYAGSVVTVPMTDDAPLIDLDDETALAEMRRRLP